MAMERHAEYVAHLPCWQRARDVIAGEDAVKAGGAKYLPRLDAQSDEDYEAYKARAAFFGATARTLGEYVDLVLRRAPVVSVPAELQGFTSDCDGWGADFTSYARRVLTEVLSVGRCGSLVLWEGGSGEGRRVEAGSAESGSPEGAKSPVVMLFRAEEIVNWEVTREGGCVRLCRVELERGNERVALWLRDGVCIEERWVKSGDDWVLVRRAVLKRGEADVGFIPFVFHGPSHSRPDVERSPLSDIISANLDHYRLDADLKYGVHFTALPTAWVTGFDKGTSLKIGSTTAWLSEIPGASAGFLEFTGAGLEHVEQAIEKAESRMALLGARMLEVAPGDKSAGGRQLCGLGSIVASLNGSLSRVLQLAEFWAAGNPLQTCAASIAMNTDLSASTMSGEDLNAVVGAWRSGAISRETMLDLLKRGEILPDGRTVAEERALIYRR